MQHSKLSGRLTKWAIELEEFDIEYKPWTVIKGQAVANFVVEFAKLDRAGKEEVEKGIA